MNSATTSEIISSSPSATLRLGETLGRRLKGGEFLELTGDLGSGKTVLIKGIGKGLGIKQPISSPTFTISRVYEAGEKSFCHFDFYRIDSKDIVARELAEAARDKSAVVAVEWAEHVKDALPEERLSIRLAHLDSERRRIIIEARGQKYQDLLGKLK